MIWLVVLILIIYVVSAINNLRDRLSRIEKGQVATQSVLPQPIAQQPKPEEAKKFEKPAVKPESREDWESKIGGKLFTVIGAIAVIFGIAFFLKYAFDHDLISETGRVIMGILAGLIVLIAGQATKKKYPLYSQLLSGLSLGIFYLSIFAAFNFYQLVPQSTAIVGMILTTALGIYLALSSDSLPLAAFAQFGGLITPLLLSSGVNNPHGLFGYLLVLNLAILFVNFAKPWQALNLENLIGTAILYASWFSAYYTPDQFNLAFGYATIFFLLFLTISFLRQFFQKIQSDEQTLSLLTLNSLFYYVVAYVLLSGLYHAWLGPFTFSLAIFYLTLGLTAIKKKTAGDHFHDFLFGISFIFFFIAIPIQFKHYVIGVGWAAEALVLIILGFQIQSRKLRYLGHFIFIASTLQVLINSTITQVPLSWVNNRTISALMTVMAMGAAGFIYHLKKSQIESAQETSAFAPKNEFGEAISALILQAYLIIFWVTTLQLWDFQKSHNFAIAWSLLASILTMIGLRTKNALIRSISYLSFLLVAGRLLFFDVEVNLRAYTPLVNARVLAFLISILLISLLAYWLRKHADLLTADERGLILPAMFFGSNVLMLWLISVEVLDFFNQRSLLVEISYGNAKNAALSVAWIFYAILALIAGIGFKNQGARLFAVLLFGLAIAKVFLYDTVNLNNLYRFISYITLGVILLLAGYLYNRFKERIIEFIKAQ